MSELHIARISATLPTRRPRLAVWGMLIMAAFALVRSNPPVTADSNGPKAAERKPALTGLDWWSFKKPVEPPIPAVNDAQWPRSDIDRFILNSIEKAGIKPVEDASREALIRRTYFDLIGLPPPPSTINAFVRDSSPQAFEKVVDDLLASRHFGERWGRHWLDAARFAESTGKERNHTYPEAWRYRDYVIDAFNSGIPYDRFIKEQIAGDLLRAANDAERDRLKVATGFLAIGPKSLNTPRREQFLLDLIDEQIDVVSRAVMGITAACARCHDHKFDPITQRDYYALAGIFRSTDTHYGAGEDLPINREPSDLITLKASSMAEPAEARTVDAGPARRAGFRAKQARMALLRAGADAQGLTNGPAREMAAYLARLATNGPAHASTPSAMGVSEGFAKDYNILNHGELGQRGPKMPRGFIAALTPPATPAIPGDESGRLQLADWLTSVENPLTPRVMANRIWLHLFGRGIVRTADDFGNSGDRPTHPELLDYLALRFVSNGWSVKGLIREIVLSRAYQLASTYDPSDYNVDPGDLLVWRMPPRRLDAESIRDAMLAVSGRLDERPLHGSVVADVGERFVGFGLRPERFNVLMNKRSVYLPIVRECVSDELDLFDFAEPSLVAAQRDTTTVPAQALYLMNSPFVREQARAFARRVLSMPGLSEEQRIAAAYRSALGRSPTPKENRRIGDFLHDKLDAMMPAVAGAESPMEKPWSEFCQALLASAEFRYLR